MRDISLHLLDLVQNSIKAEATLIELAITVDEKSLCHIVLRDNGKGMSADYANAVQDPFVTSRTERKVGLGIPLFKENAQKSGGHMVLKSQIDVGTVIEAVFDTKSIDCLPMGDIAQTMYSLIIMNPLTPEFTLNVKTQKGEATFDTRQVRDAVGGLPLNEPEIAAWIHEALNEELTAIMEG